MSSAGRKKDNLEPFQVAETGAFTTSKTYNGLEQDGVRLFVDQTVGEVTTIKVYTASTNTGAEVFVKEFTIQGRSAAIFRADCLSTVRVEVSSLVTTTLSLVPKPSSAEAIIDKDAKQTEIDTLEKSAKTRHDDLICVLDKVVTELEKTNTYYALIMDHRL